MIPPSPQQQRSHPAQWQSYQHDTTVYSHVSTTADDSGRQLPPPPQIIIISSAPRMIPRKWRCTTAVVTLCMIILLLVVVVVVVGITVFTTTPNQTTNDPNQLPLIAAGISSDTTTSATTVSILPNVLTDQVGWDDKTTTKDSLHTKTIVIDKEEQNILRRQRHQPQENHRIRMIRRQLQYLQEHMEGMMYYPPPPCTITHHHSVEEHKTKNDIPQQQPQASEQVEYDMVAMGWIQQRPMLARSDDSQDRNAFDQHSTIHHCHYDNDDNNMTNSNIGIVIIQVQNERDVQIAVPILAELYQKYQFPFRIRSGGHHKAGYSSLTDVRNHKYDHGDGAVLSLSLLNHLRIVPASLPETNKVTTTNAPDKFTSIVIGPAVKVQDILQQVTLPYQYGGVIGFCGLVAEGGFVLGGGFGMQSRMYGLGLDSVVSFRIVLYNGTALTTSFIQNPDLHWALLGAGSGSYGVITEMEYQIHPVSDILHTVQLIFHDVSNLAYFLYQIGQMESRLPDNLILMYDEMNAISLLWTGTNDTDVKDGNMKLQNLVESIMSSATDSFDSHPVTVSWTGTFGITNSSEQASNKSKNNHKNDNNSTEYFDWGTSAWAAGCWTGFLLPENNTMEIWNDIIHHMDLGLKHSQPYLYPDVELWGGAINRRTSNATAFPYRSAIYNVGILLIIPLNEPNGTEVFERESKKINEWWYRVDQYLTGSYVNYPTVSLLDHPDDPHHYARVLWGENLPRLVQIKQQVDPNNVFQFPMSVPNVL